MSRQPGGRHVDPGQMLRNIFVSRAFTCYQMEATLTERLPAFVKRIHSPVAIIFGLLDTFYDEQAPLFEVRASVQRIIDALHTLKQENVSILLASLDVQLASKERNGLFPKLKAAMDRVFYVTEDERGQRILHESQQDFGRMKGGNRTLNRYNILNPKSKICNP
jgi:hypothetical protein